MWRCGGDVAGKQASRLRLKQVCGVLHSYAEASCGEASVASAIETFPVHLDEVESGKVAGKQASRLRLKRGFYRHATVHCRPVAGKQASRLRLKHRSLLYCLELTCGCGEASVASAIET